MTNILTDDVTRKGDFLEVYGRKFWPFDARPHEVHLDAIAFGLAGIFRYCGGTRITVAEHSVLLSRVVAPENQLWALLHDSTEALGFPDVPTPVKIWFPDYKLAETNCMHVVAQRFGLVWPEPAEVKEKDKRFIFDEKIQWLSKDVEWGLKGEPLGVTIECWSPERAEQEFLKRFRELTKQGNL